MLLAHLMKKKPTGCVVNSIMQITNDILAISVNKQNYTNECIKKALKFAVSILSTDVEEDIIPVFGFQSGREIVKFENIHSEKISNLEVISNSVGYLICDVKEIIEVDSHTIFLAKIIDGDILNKKTPMTYAYYHQVKKGTTPKTAPSYIEEKIEAKLAFRCSICSWIYEGDITKEPDSFTCPVCKQPKSAFVKV